MHKSFAVLFTISYRDLNIYIYTPYIGRNIHWLADKLASEWALSQNEHGFLYGAINHGKSFINVINNCQYMACDKIMKATIKCGSNRAIGCKLYTSYISSNSFFPPLLTCIPTQLSRGSLCPIEIYFDVTPNWRLYDDKSINSNWSVIYIQKTKTIQSIPAYRVSFLPDFQTPFDKIRKQCSNSL